MLTIRKVSEQIRNGMDSALALGDFLDAFRGMSPAEREAALREPPAAGLSDPHQAYLAAVGEYLAHHHGIAVPDWVYAPAGFLKTPVFYSSCETLKATLLVESPGEFRRRNLFVSANALDRV